jgi:hypothetical protein
MQRVAERETGYAATEQRCCQRKEKQLRRSIPGVVDNEREPAERNCTKEATRHGKLMLFEPTFDETFTSNKERTQLWNRERKKAFVYKTAQTSTAWIRATRYGIIMRKLL